MYNNKIREYRKMQGITLTKLAKEAGITPGYLCHLEKGHKKNPSMQIMENISLNTTYYGKDIAAGTLKDIHKSITNIKQLSTELGIGEMTLEDIIKELEKPGRDPREDMPRPILKSDVLEMKDLKPGMQLKGTVRNVIDFGAFIDIGVHQDGLVHISQMTDRYIKHPLEVVSVGDIVDVEVLSVDEKKGRISLTMKLKSKNS